MLQNLAFFINYPRYTVAIIELVLLLATHQRMKTPMIVVDGRQHGVGQIPDTVSIRTEGENMVFYATRYLDMPNTHQSRRSTHQVLPEATRGIAPNTTVLSKQSGFNRSLDNALNAVSAVNAPRYAVQFTVSYPRLERNLAKHGQYTNEGLNRQLKGQSFSREHLDGEYLLLEKQGDKWVRRGLHFIERPIANRELDTAISTPDYGSPDLQAARRNFIEQDSYWPQSDVSDRPSFSHHEYAADERRLGRNINEDLPENTSSNADSDIDPPLDLIIGHLSL